MPIPPDTLTPDDYELLNYVNKFDSVSKEQILKKFEKTIEAVEYRLELLEKSDFSRSASSYIQNSSYIVEESEQINAYGEWRGTGVFHISPLGKKALQDYQKKKKSDTKDLWLQNAWIPIIVAFATTVITNYLLPKLPLILQWFSSFF